MSGILYVVATPIGNLEDLTPRARQTLASVDLVAAEDTRHTGRLLSHIGVKTRLMALHDHNEEKAAAKVIALLQSGQSVALVSDAGTPLVSDPGYRLVHAAHENDIVVVPIPGASAVTAALSVAGLATDRFCFEGFLPARQAARRKTLQSLQGDTRTLVFYESVHRIQDTLLDMCDVLGEQRLAFIGRELSKMHEQCVQGTLGSLREQLATDGIVSKGEFVVIVAGNETASESSVDVDRLLQELAVHVPVKEAARIAAAVTGGKKNALYQRFLELKESP